MKEGSRSAGEGGGAHCLNSTLNECGTNGKKEPGLFTFHFYLKLVGENRLRQQQAEFSRAPEGI